MPFTIRIEADGPVTTVTLDQPKIRNAFSPPMIAELTDAFTNLSAAADVRVIVLTGEGTAFSAGADLNWMKSMVEYSQEENVADAGRLDAMFYAMITCPKPIIGRINGPAIGGGLGLVAVCDVAVGAMGAKFGFSEVNLGLVPAVIAPYVMRKTGVAPLTEYFLTGTRFDAETARRIGLLHYTTPPANLDGIVRRRVDELLTSGPNAIAAAKELINTVSATPLDDVRSYTAKLIATLRTTAEGQEGTAAFLEKRKPSWIQD